MTTALKLFIVDALLGLNLTHACFFEAAQDVIIHPHDEVVHDESPALISPESLCPCDGGATINR